MRATYSHTFLLAVVIAVLAEWATACSSSSYDKDPPWSPCAEINTYYCDGRCINRSARCGPSDPCASNCRLLSGRPPTSAYHHVDVFYARLYAVGNPSRAHNVWQLHLYHMFVRFRGFVYEHGGSYWYHELDTLSPAYKYRPDGDESVFRVSDTGVSTCTRADVLRFREKYIAEHGDYDFFSNNCQHYANCLIQTLLDNSRSLHLTDCNDHTRAVARKVVTGSRGGPNSGDWVGYVNMSLPAGANNGTNCLPIAPDKCFCGCEAPKSSNSGGFFISRTRREIFLLSFLGIIVVQAFAFSL